MKGGPQVEGEPDSGVVRLRPDWHLQHPLSGLHHLQHEQGEYRGLLATPLAAYICALVHRSTISTSQLNFSNIFKLPLYLCDKW